MAHKPDPIKAMITQAVQHHLITGPDQPPIPPQPTDVESVSSRIVSPLVTQIIVKTWDQGTRCFYVKVSEQY